jgi:SEC-C motif
MARPNDPCPCGSGKKYKLCHGRGVLDHLSGGRVTLPSKAQLFRRVTTTVPVVTIYIVQVWKPTFEDGEILRKAEFNPYGVGSEDLENTMLFCTITPEVAFRIAGPEVWATAPSWKLIPDEAVIEEGDD